MIPNITSKIKSSKFVFVLLVIFLKKIFESLEIIIDNKIPIKNKDQIKNKNNTLIVLAWNFYEDIKKNKLVIESKFFITLLNV